MRCSLRAQLQARLDAGNEPSQRTDPVILICELSPRWNLLPLLVPVRCLHRQFRGYPPLLRPIPELCTCHRVGWSAAGAVVCSLVRVCRVCDYSVVDYVSQLWNKIMYCCFLLLCIVYAAALFNHVFSYWVSIYPTPSAPPLSLLASLSGRVLSLTLPVAALHDLRRGFGSGGWVQSFVGLRQVRGGGTDCLPLCP